MSLEIPQFDPCALFSLFTGFDESPCGRVETLNWRDGVMAIALGGASVGLFISLIVGSELTLFFLVADVGLLFAASYVREWVDLKRFEEIADDFRETNHQLRESVRELDQEIVTLGSENKTYLEQNQRHEAHIKTLKEENVTYIEQNDTLKATTKELKNQIGDLNTTTASLENQINTLNNNLSELNLENTNYKTQNAENQKQINSLTKETKKLETLNTEIKEQLEALKNSKKDLVEASKYLKTLKQNITVTETKLEVLNNQLGEKNNKYTELNDHHETLIEELKKTSEIFKNIAITMSSLILKIPELDNETKNELQSFNSEIRSIQKLIPVV